jgi:hypothetical protein
MKKLLDGRQVVVLISLVIAPDQRQTVIGA